MSERGLRVVVPHRGERRLTSPRGSRLWPRCSPSSRPPWRGRGRGRHRPLDRLDAVTLTVSGGVSLGAYEAGLAWGIIQFLKAAPADGGHTFLRPRLAAVAGASAGG